MKIKMILPSLTEAVSSYWRPIKYSLFPPLGLATLAGHVSNGDEIVIQDEHVEKLDLNDCPDIVVIEVYITSALRAYKIADHYRRKGAYVVLGGLHVTSLPDEAAHHADTIFIGPGDDTWPRFLEDFRNGRAEKVYESKVRSLENVPRIRRDLIKRHLYLVPNSIVVSRGCPHSCDFCYKDSFYAGGKSFYTRRIDDALSEIQSLPGKHLFFLDDNIFADQRFAESLFDGMKSMGRIWQAAGTVEGILKPGLLEKAVDSGLRSLFVGFETLDMANLNVHRKHHNMKRDYNLAVSRLHSLGVMINASFVFGMDSDDETVFDRTVEWAIGQGITTATFHILTPYPGTGLYKRMKAEGRLLHDNWDLYDTRHVVFKPAKMSPETLESGYWRAYEEFYKWGSIIKSACTKEEMTDILRHVAYAGGWKKFESFWSLIVKAKQVSRMLPMLENILSGFSRDRDTSPETIQPCSTRNLYDILQI